MTLTVFVTTIPRNYHFLQLNSPSTLLTFFKNSILVNGIDFDEVRIDLSKRQQLTPQFQGKLPFRHFIKHLESRYSVEQVCIVMMLMFPNWSSPKLPDDHAILIYLACSFPGIADHWYPADLFLRAKIHSVLDWHHSNLHSGVAGYVLNSTLGPALGLPLNPEAAAKSEKLLSASLGKIESFWLKGRGRFLLGSTQPSIADLSLVCEIMQLELVDEKDRERILGPHKRVMKWVTDTKNATSPHFDQVHSVLLKVKGKLQSKKAVGETNQNVLPSKL
ncbi:hypothetical protein SASPL_133363 [Salvia splendens]|uniref:glutathione transferase n=1 Tax=Salvia splendens TaxID=180675 RepID=A0A8X8X418_SALSN|nr:hypothetical protein SASPL_133363 [Salvia splendens]